MIILDVETGGLNPNHHALLSIGAVDYNSGEEFYIECHAGLPNEIDSKALEINGFTYEQVYSEEAIKTKPYRDVAYVKFLEWCKGRDTLIGGQQVGSFDLLFLKAIHNDTEYMAQQAPNYYNYTLIKDIGPWPFGHRSVDLHSVAYAKFGESLSLDGILKKIGLSPEPKPHNALVGARLERDAFKILLN